MFSAAMERFPLLLPYGLTCLIAHMLLYITFRYLPFVFAAAPWKVSPSFTAHKIVAFCAMNHWCYLGLIHVWSFDYSNSNSNAGYYVPAGYEIAQIAMGALLCWDIPLSLTGCAGPIDTMMHLHHFGMVVVTACVLGGTGTHVAPIFLGAIEISSIPLQVVDFFHPKKKISIGTNTRRRRQHHRRSFRKLVRMQTKYPEFYLLFFFWLYGLCIFHT